MDGTQFAREMTHELPKCHLIDQIKSYRAGQLNNILIVGSCK